MSTWPAPCSRSWYVVICSLSIPFVQSHSRIDSMIYLYFWSTLMFWFLVMIVSGLERSISEDSLRRYVHFASESCIQELLSASDCNRVGNGSDGWKLLTFDNGVEISKRRSGSFDTFRSRWLLRSVSPQQFITVANAIDAAKVVYFHVFVLCLCQYFESLLRNT